MQFMKPEDWAFVDAVYAKCVDDGGCMIWKGACTSTGYPRMTVDNRVVTVRRVMAAQKIGRPLKPSEFASSTCNDPRCLFWDHIRVVTVAKRRSEVGADGGYSSRTKGAKISAYKRSTEAKLIGGQEAAEAIRLDPRPSHEVAPDHGISPSMVRKIRRGVAWKPLQNSPFSGLGAR